MNGHLSCQNENQFNFVFHSSQRGEGGVIAPENALKNVLQEFGKRTAPNFNSNYPNKFFFGREPRWPIRACTGEWNLVTGRYDSFRYVWPDGKCNLQRPLSLSDLHPTSLLGAT